MSVKKIVEVKNRVANQLTGAVKRNIATPVDFVISGPDGFQKRTVGQQIRFVAALAEGINGRVFAKKQVVGGRELITLIPVPVGDFLGDNPGEEPFLLVPGGLVINQPQQLHFNLFI